MKMTVAEYDEMFEIIDRIDGIDAEYPSLQDLQEYLEYVDKADIKYLMWLDEHLPAPKTVDQDDIRFIINDYLKSNLVIVEPDESAEAVPDGERTAFAIDDGKDKDQ